MVGMTASDVTKPASSDIEEPFSHFGDEFRSLGGEWSFDSESLLQVPNQIYWQDLSQCVNLDSAIAGTGEISSSWASPSGFLSDGNESKTDRRDSTIGTDAVSERRRAQNRASQRAYRERRDRHVKCLEEKLEDVVSHHQELSKEHARLRVEHERVLEIASHRRVELRDLKESQLSPVTFINRKEDGDQVLVKVMLCRKECSDRKFSEVD